MVSLMQRQDWRSGGRDLRSATRGGTLVGVGVRFVAGGEKRVRNGGRVTARLRVARRLRVAAV
eukprot:6869116-Prymnesium_polylepis.1